MFQLSRFSPRTDNIYFVNNIHQGKNRTENTQHKHRVRKLDCEFWWYLNTIFRIVFHSFVCQRYQLFS